MPHSPVQDEPRVLFVYMPWARPERPALGLGTLKAVLEREGIGVDVLYLNVDLANRLGARLYNLYASLGYRTFRSEIFFTPYYFQQDPRKFFKKTLKPHLREWIPELAKLLPSGFLPAKTILYSICKRLTVKHADAFLRDAFDRVDWDRYDIIGFSLMFEQTLASLSLASRVKEMYPEKTILFGGPSCEGEMGEEVLRSFPCVDVVAQGEADRTIVPLVRALRNGDSLAEVRGIGYRKNGKVHLTDSPEQLIDLDWLPVPDYSDYFESTPGIENYTTKIFFETSRGCWWGQKSLCSFCGLNANGLNFRRKSPDRAVEELLDLEARYGIRQFSASDNILDYSYFKTFLPKLQEVNDQRADDERLSVFYEIKTNVKKQQIADLVRAGVDAVQPGIESFSDGILSRMKKGNTALDQIQFLKWSTELGLSAYYGLIHSNPYDEVSDYEIMIRAIDHVDHLPPPNFVTPLALDRFSPYFIAPESYGISNMRPGPKYSVIFPPEEIDRAKLAYDFDYDHAQQQDQALQDSIQAFLERVERWKKSYEKNLLTYDLLPGAGIRISDRRGGKSTVLELEGVEAQIFSYCDRYRTRDRIARNFPDADPQKIDLFLEAMAKKRLLYVGEQGHYLSLPVARPRLAEMPLPDRAGGGEHVAAPAANA